MTLCAPTTCSAGPEIALTDVETAGPRQLGSYWCAIIVLQSFHCLRCMTSRGYQHNMSIYRCSTHVAADETDFSPLQTPTEFDEFCLVMEQWYAEALGPGRPFIMDDSLVFRVYCSSAIFVQTKGKASDKLDFALRALEQCGCPPKKLEPIVHF